MFILPNLPYDYNALEPFIDEETMHLHHEKHHAAYVKNLNDALAGNDALLNMDINELLKNLDKVPHDLFQKVKNNAGGVANHNLFWNIMCKQSEYKNPEGKLMEGLVKTFGSFEEFKNKFSTAAMGQFGSGWAWLVDGDHSLDIITTSNQDSPVTEGRKPLLALDVWEHAYYLKYRNVRADYISAWWNIVNWKEVEKRYDGIQ